MTAPRVLIIDDSMIVREMLRASLEDPPLSAVVEESENGADALEQVLRSRFDCVICDVEMPGLTGLEFLARVRQRLSRTELPVLLLTGHEELEQKLRGFDAGASDFLSKPWEAAELIARVETHVELVRMHRSLTERSEQLQSAKTKIESTLEELRQTSLMLARARNEPVEQQIALARSIQLAMVPSRDPIDLGILSVSGLVEPAASCGGDFWTYLPGERDATLLIGDVTGHGIGAAMITSVVKSCVDTLVLERARFAPEALTQRLNEVIYRTTRGDLTMSAFVVRIDNERRTLRFASAGHCRQYVVTGPPGERRPEWLRARGSLLGSAPVGDVPFAEHPYAPGTFLVLYTDGLIECADPEGAPYREQRLRQILTESRATDAEGLRDEIMRDLEVFRGAAIPADDITLVTALLG